MGYEPEVRHYARQLHEVCLEGPHDFRWVSRVLPLLRLLAHYLGYQLVPFEQAPAPKQPKEVPGGPNRS